MQSLDETLKTMDYNPSTNTEVIELKISDDDFLSLARTAHGLDITFNHLICAVLQQKIDEEKE